MLIEDLPPICRGTEAHFEDHDFGRWGGVGLTVVYWPECGLPRFWSHDSDYPWGRNGRFSGYEQEHIARHQIVAWLRRGKRFSTGPGHAPTVQELQCSGASRMWMEWEKENT